MDPSEIILIINFIL